MSDVPHTPEADDQDDTQEWPAPQDEPEEPHSHDPIQLPDEDDGADETNEETQEGKHYAKESDDDGPYSSPDS